MNVGLGGGVGATGFVGGVGAVGGVRFTTGGVGATGFVGGVGGVGTHFLHLASTLPVKLSNPIPTSNRINSDFFIMYHHLS